MFSETKLMQEFKEVFLQLPDDLQKALYHFVCELTNNKEKSSHFFQKLHKSIPSAFRMKVRHEMRRWLFCFIGKRFSLFSTVFAV